MVAPSASLSPHDLDAAKTALRADMRARRRGLDGGEAAQRAAARFLGSLPLVHGTVIAGYWPQGSELDCRPLLTRLQERGFAVALPVVVGEGQPLVFRGWSREADLRLGTQGIPEPESDGAVDPDIVIVPLLAFDSQGWRLGQGGGYYDRTIEALRARRPVLAAGFAFAEQEIAAVPHGRGDQKLDWIVTENEARRLG
jgi:5-formyltetrahydrofolate cyclo-ligase